jgi:hypothetical protein
MSNSASLDIRKFNLNQIKFQPNTIEKHFGPIIVLNGKRNTGKSVILRAILHSKREIPLGVVMSGTEEVNVFFSEFIPRILIQSQYSENHITKVKDRQKKRLQTRLNQLKDEGRSDMDSRIFIILDDCLYDDAWTRTSLIREIFCNGRHWNIMMIITLQYPIGIPPLLRENIDYTFILRQFSLRNRKLLYENFASIFPTFEMFCQVLDSVTDNYCCMVVDNTVQSNLLQDVVYWYKAPLDIPPFRMCAEEYWEASESMNSVASSVPEYNPDMIQRRKNGVNMRVSMIEK